MKEKHRTWLVCLILVLGTALLYAPVLNFSYVSLDDPLYLDDHIKRGVTWGSLCWCFENTSGFLWNPLTWVSHLLDCQFFGAWMGGHHATNVVLHTFSSVILFCVLRRMTGAFWRSAMVAALFAWHPLHVESVAWIAERKDVLSGLFWMLTLWAYLRYVEECKRPSSPNPNLAPNPTRPLAFYFLALSFFVMGLMSKPILVTLPFVLLLLDWWPLGRMQAKPGAIVKKILALAVEKIPFFVISVMFSVITVMAVGQHSATLAAIPLSKRMDTAVTNYFLYAAKTFWPGHMVVQYPFEFHWAAWQVAGAVIFVAAVTLFALWFGKRRPYVLLGWLWYLGILVPVIGLMQVGTQQIADRYTYLPSIGLFVIICWGAHDLFSRWRHGALLLGGLGWAVLVACGLVAGHQLQYWQNSEALFTHDLEIYPDNFFVHGDYAGYFLDQNNLDRAIEESRKSIALKPDLAFGHAVLGAALFKLGKVSDAIDQFVVSLQIDPTAINPRIGYAKALMAQGQNDQAVEQLNLVLAADRDNSEAHCVLGKAFLTQGHLDEAGAQFATAASLVASYPDAQLQLAIVLARQGKTSEAVANYRAGKSVPTNVQDSLVLNNLAWILAASPFAEDRDGPTAVALATLARDQDKAQHPVILGTLADAYAEAGRFDEAIATAQQAHDLAVAKGAKDLAARNLELLEIYRSHKPFHETLDFQH